MEATKTEEIVELKRSIRFQINQAAALGTLNGHDLLGIMMNLLAEMVARVDDQSARDEIVATVVGFFPFAVTMEIETPQRITLQ